MIQTSAQRAVKMQLPSRAWGLHQGAAGVQQKGCGNSLITRIPAAPVTTAAATAAPPVCCSQPPSPSAARVPRRLRRAVIGRSGQFLPLINPETPKDSELL